MRCRFFPLVALAFLLGACASPAAKQSAAKSKNRMTVRTTAYTAFEPGGGGTKNAIGGRLRFGGSVDSAAADWSWLPLGTRFRMVDTGRIYVIEDYGSALVGRKTVDLYFPKRSMVRAWGVRHKEIEILEWGSPAMSLKLLSGRQRAEYVRRMVVALRKGDGRPGAQLAMRD
jgi:3D (Asp-Asp-Asp) domain-containing protein